MTTGGLIAQPEPWHKGSRRDSSADGITECLRAPKPDLRLWRGPGPRTTVAGAVGRMAMRWGRMKAIVQDRYGSADVLDFRDVAPRVRSRGRAGQGRGRWRGLGRLALHDRSAVPHAHPRLRAAGTADPGPGYQRRGTCRSGRSGRRRLSARRTGVWHLPGRVRRVRPGRAGQAGADPDGSE